jgi:acyl-CoA synthetase (AMP-forming)/AMP-acid ligase II
MKINVPRDFGARCAQVYPDKVAFVDGDARLTWGGLRTRARHLAGALQELGIGKGDPVALLAHDHLPLVEHWHACLEIGAVRVGVNYRYARREIAHIVGDCESRALIVEEDLLPLAEAALAEVARPPILIGIGASHGLELDYEDLVASGTEPELPELAEGDRLAISYTSGTTGLPKGAIFTQRGVREAITWLPLNVGLQHEDVWSNALPSSGAAVIFTIANAVNGMTCVLPSGRFAPGRFLDQIEASGVSSVLLVPTMLSQLVEELEVRDAAPSSLRLVTYGSMPSTPALIRAAKDRFGCEFQQWYGATETTAGPVVILREEDHARGLAGEPELLSSCGVAQPHVDLEIRDAEGTVLPTGEVGEVWMRGPVVFGGYLNRDEETAEVFRGEWLCPGDLGRLDERGRLFLVDRKKFMIISGGYNVFPVVVENVLAEHPEVNEVAVIGAPHPAWGEAVVAVVSLHAGATVGAAELVEHCDGQLAAWEVPKHVEIIDELPKGATAKIQKQDLRARFRGDPGLLPWNEVAAG